MGCYHHRSSFHYWSGESKPPYWHKRKLRPKSHDSSYWRSQYTKKSLNCQYQNACSRSPQWQNFPKSPNTIYKALFRYLTYILADKSLNYEYNVTNRFVNFPNVLKSSWSFSHLTAVTWIPMQSFFSVPNDPWQYCIAWGNPHVVVQIFSGRYIKHPSYATTLSS